MLDFNYKKELFHMELVKHGIAPEKATCVAEIFASGKSNKPLTIEEIQLTEEIWEQWQRHYKCFTSALRKRPLVKGDNGSS
ncbi:hypothetical protein [Scytonema sp. NUACC26]|uniref:hypothetical protein n=1 Tax=Scytonema sp. NUACC26 TaxID=3140176 RepID=UPI0034DBEEC5